ncbi:sodium-dependent transporter [Dysosmobacter sp.]|mgnify:FL=1|jgi:NSS family neurotransmitter:Na+ symporter|uniref:sodium-dependent transporter n=1 Tax=Dysosmobacter sp. TaxID=2591382 RepID=UPI002672DF68|nr:sodium-dependent transporter [Dysosmobacter sp.]MCI6017214.1 sodium-dependent transporter [Dysosmobacter sp.]MCI7214144.1 sodium-dependent transporter [Dysosmobacter sp.]MDY3653867.1 sodium-dependent transporter [Dysosmobacter sp.]
MEHKKNTKSFASRWGFILASVGSAVGMANVWGFPNKMGSNGGGAFLLIYLLFVFIFSYVGLPAEFAMGRRAATGTLGAYENAWDTRSKSAGKVGGLLGWLPLAGSLCIAIGYAVIVTYVLKALVDSLLGTLLTTDTAAWFGAFSSTPYSVIPYHIVVVVGTLLTLFLGARSIEKTNKVMMPVFFVIFLILAVRVALLPGAAEGYVFMFTPRWEALTNPMIWIWAMGQAFFSLSVTGSGMIVYGAYLSKDEDVVGVAQHTALFDTIAAVVAALVIIPACFSYGLDVGAGPSLLFVTLPTILQDIPMGQLFAIILYMAMIFAGVSSLQNMFEVVAESLMHKFPKLNRVTVLVLLGALCLGFGIGMETISKWGPWMDLVSIYIIPIGATLGAVSWFYVMKKDALLDAINTGSTKKRGNLWYNVGRYVYVPLAIILCCVALFMHVAF